MGRKLEILKLDQISRISQGFNDSGVDLCHVFGIFLQEDISNNNTYWLLSDETCLKGLKIKICGKIETYPKPKRGDIIRIHRLSFDHDIRFPIVTVSKNVVIWPAYVYDPQPITSAKQPTITDYDNTRRRVLEAFHCTTLTRVNEIKRPPQNLPNNELPHLDVAGRLEERHYDTYNNVILKIFDGSGYLDVRVFCKQKSFDSVDHFEKSIKLETGDFVCFSGVKLDTKEIDKLRVNLSANTSDGRSVRKVSRDSILGVLLEQSIDHVPEQQPITSSQQLTTLRRSPRLNPDLNASSPRLIDKTLSPRLNTHSQDIPHNDLQSNSSTINTTLNHYISTITSDVDHETRNETNSTRYTKLCDIPLSNGITFYDIAGQVRGKPQETKLFKNWLLQLHDGSKPSFGSYYSDQIDNPCVDCACIMVYSKQKISDTDQHAKLVQTLDEGDLILVRNVKVSFRDGRIKFEMNANLAHGKSISVIDKESELGATLMDIVTNPDVAELGEDATFSTPPENDTSYIEECE